MSVSGSESGHSSAEPAVVRAGRGRAEGGRTGVWRAGGWRAEGGRAEGGRAGGGRAWAGLAADRQVIELVRVRPLLYTRSELPVASHHSKVNQLWQEVADQMNWTVAEVRRKWSHIRSAYSRHLRQEALGSRTVRGRRVSRWHLADEVEFLREHMGTDTRAPMSLLQMDGLTNLKQVSMLEPELEPKLEPESSLIEEQPASPSWQGEAPAGAWGSGAEEQFTSPGRSPPGLSPPGSPDSRSFFPFFSGLREEYRQLTSGRRRRFRRTCLASLHALLDEQEQHNDVLDNVQIVLHEPAIVSWLAPEH